MTRDYAKNKTSKIKYKKKTSRILIIVMLLIIIAVIGSIMPNKHKPRFFNLTQQYFVDSIGNSVSKLKRPKKITPTNTITKAATSPHFDFYNILPGKKNIAEQQEYELAISKTNDFADADRLKAELTLLGFTTNITPIYEKGVQIYYINIGPYKDKKAAAWDQKKLRKNKFRSWLKKIH